MRGVVNMDCEDNGGQRGLRFIAIDEAEVIHVEDMSVAAGGIPHINGVDIERYIGTIVGNSPQMVGNKWQD